jgi:hypothetical protein
MSKRLRPGASLVHTEAVRVSRRDALRLASLAALGMLPGIQACPTASPQTREFVVGTRTRVVRGDEMGTRLAVLDLHERTIRLIDVPMRGHSVVQHPTDPDRVVVVAHRAQHPPGAMMPLPGMDSCEVSLSAGAVTRVFRCDEGHHYFGHGAFDAAGRVLFTTENDFERAGAGVITVRDVASLRSIGRFPSHGKDPHEMRLINDGRVALIANGGYQLHPDYGPIVLNSGRVISSLTWVDVASGALLEEVRLENSTASLRHFDVIADGTTLVALQDGEVEAEGDRMPVALYRRGHGLTLLHGPPGMGARTRQHALSCVILPEARLGAVTHPKGNLVSFWDVGSGELRGTLDLDAASGVALSPDRTGFFVSSGRGNLFQVRARDLALVQTIEAPEDDVEWDSHLTNVALPALRG